MSVTTTEAAREAVTPSIVRTVTPIVVGFVLTYLFGVETGWLREFAANIGLTEDSISSGLTLTVASVLSSVYYAVVRFLETRVKPQWGRLLGQAKLPVYEDIRDSVADRFNRRDDGGYGLVEIAIGVLVLVVALILLLRYL